MKSIAELNELSAEIVAKKQAYQALHFDYPLDLLLFLIKKNEMDIYDIPIAEITEQFLEYLDYITVPDLDKLSEFYAVAAELLRIKSQMLLPNPQSSFEGEDEDPRAGLVEKIIEFQRLRALSRLMEERENEVEWSVERKKMQRILPFDDAEVWEEADSYDLLKFFSQIMRGVRQERVLDLTEDITLEEKNALMLSFFATKGECFFTDLIVRKDSVMDIVCAFMALLEAVKYKRAVILQNKIYADIKILPANKKIA